MTGRASRDKGHNFEREFCRWVREEFDMTRDQFGRNLKQYGLAQEGDTDALGLFLPECKNHKRLSLPTFWRQAVEQAKRRNLMPLLIYKVHGVRGFRAVLPDPTAWDTGASWRWDYEYTRDVGPALLALIVREQMGQ